MLLFPGEAVGAVGVPVKDGDDKTEFVMLGVRAEETCEIAAAERVPSPLSDTSKKSFNTVPQVPSSPPGIGNLTLIRKPHYFI